MTCCYTQLFRLAFSPDHKRFSSCFSLDVQNLPCSHQIVQKPEPPSQNVFKGPELGHKHDEPRLLYSHPNTLNSACLQLSSYQQQRGFDPITINTADRVDLVQTHEIPNQRCTDDNRLAVTSYGRRLLQITTQAFVKHGADQQFSTVDGGYRGADQHTSVIGVHLRHLRLSRMNVLDSDDLEKAEG